MGACCLFSSNRKEALNYLQKCAPDVAKDYYLLLGIAKMYHHKYEEADKDFNKYHTTLGWYTKLSKPAFFKAGIERSLDRYKTSCASGLNLPEDSLSITIINLGASINSRYHEYAAMQAPWDSLMYFTTTRPKKGTEKIMSNLEQKEHIVYANQSMADSVVQIADINGLKSGVNMSVAGIDRNKQLLYFYKGKRKHGSLNYAAIKNGKAKKKILGGSINHKAYKETCISIADDGSVYCIMNRMGGRGGKDIWYGKQTSKNKIQKLQNLGSIVNTEADEEGVYVTPDGGTLFFSSKGHAGLGGYDIFKPVKNADGTWQEPVNLGKQINSPADELFFHPSVDGSAILFSTVRDGGFGGLDIYEISGDVEKIVAIPDNSVVEM